METKQFTGTADITDGPSKFDLMMALFAPRQKSDGEQSVYTVLFRTSRGTVRACINSVTRIEDGTNESWKVSGDFVPVADHGVVFAFSGYYSTRRRKGLLGAPGGG